MLCSHPLPFLLLATAAFGIGSWEYGKFCGREDRALPIVLTLLFGLFAGSWLSFRQGRTDFFVLLAAFAVGIGAMATGMKSAAAPKTAMSAISETFSWIGAPLIALVLLHGGAWQTFDWNLHAPILMMFLPLWAGDTAGILVGSTLGRHPLAPNISPKKTVEGAIGNLLAATGAAVSLGPWVRASLPVALSCGLAIGILGQVGDLFESNLKRTANLKDSGSLLPGHGGILDRIDSLLFTAIPVALILSFS
jgi:phosphatidate cytidylyltransferase